MFFTIFESKESTAKSSSVI